MAFALVFNGTGRVDIPAKTSGGTTSDTWYAMYDMELSSFDNQVLWGRDVNSSVDALRIVAANQINWRFGAGTATTHTLSQNMPLNTRFKLEAIREAGRNIVFKIDDVEVFRLNGASFGVGGNALDVRLIGRALNAWAFTGKVYAAEIQGQEYLNITSDSETTWGDGTLNGLSTWEEYSTGSTPISFTGTIANQTFTVGDVVSLDLNPFFSGTETPFVITSIGASLAAIGLSIAAGVVFGTVTEGTATGVQVRGTDAALNTADSNLFDITVNAAPAGNSATVAFTMPQFAVAVSAETSAPTTNAVLTSEPLKDNTGTLLANQALDYVAIYNNITGELVLRVTGLSTNASGVFGVENAALAAGVTYKVDWKVTSQSAGRMPAKAAL